MKERLKDPHKITIIVEYDDFIMMRAIAAAQETTSLVIMRQLIKDFVSKNQGALKNETLDDE